MHPASNPLYATLDERQREIVEALCNGGPACQALPFGSDKSYDEMLITAAEADGYGQQILVVCASDWDSEVLKSRWERKGSEAVEHLGAPGPSPVRIIDTYNLSWHEDEHHAKHYAVCLLIGLDDAQAGYVYQAIRAARYWRAVFTGGECDAAWPLGPAGQMMEMGVVFDTALARGPRVRPSALAERVGLPA